MSQQAADNALVGHSEQVEHRIAFNFGLLSHLSRRIPAVKMNWVT
jgi:hypothetical protein